MARRRRDGLGTEEEQKESSKGRGGPARGDDPRRAPSQVAYGSQKLVVENTCFYAGNRARIDDTRDIKRGLCKYAGSWREYLEKLGVVGRDTSVHPWGD